MVYHRPRSNGSGKNADDDSSSGSSAFEEADDELRLRFALNQVKKSQSIEDRLVCRCGVEGLSTGLVAAVGSGC